MIPIGMTFLTCTKRQQAFYANGVYADVGEGALAPLPSGSVGRSHHGGYANVS